MTFHADGKWIVKDGVKIAEAVDEAWAHTIATVLDSHPALIAVCENAWEWFSGETEDTPGHRLAKQCEAALFKARGGKP